MGAEQLARRLHGRVLEPGDDAYEQARRIWNARFTGQPAAIARCRDAEEVAAALELARERGLPIAVKGGGHSYAGHSTCDEGLLVDLSPMQRVRIDAGARTARVGAGVTWGRFDEEAQASGLATTGGSVSTIGVAGLTLGGGSGYGTRKNGLAIDNLLSADVVTAGGRIRRASEDEHPDLFWALRGGGGNFGVVTSFEFRLHDVGPQVLAGQIVHPFTEAREVLRFYRDFMSGAPDEIDVYAFVLRVPPLDVFPAEHHGRLAVDLVVFYCGPVPDGEDALRELRDFGRPILNAVQPVPYTVLKSSFDEGLPAGQRYFSQAHYLKDLSDAAIDAMVDGVEGLRGAFTIAYFEALGGAVSRVAPTATAFPHREAPFSFHVLAGWTVAEEDDEVMGWARQLHDAMAPYATGGVYVNLLDRAEHERVPAAYGANYERLVALKRKWDPENVFRINHNIPPRG